jgi:hypothetical protein
MKKSKTQIIKFYPLNDKTVDFTPEPKPASKSLPKWYKSQPSQIDNGESIAQNGQPTSTVKRCMPIFDVMTSGYTLVAPLDIYIDATNPEKLTYQVPATMASFKSDIFATHDRRQYSEMPIDEKLSHKDLLRIMPFWIVSTPPGYSALFLNPLHGDPSPLTAIPGLIDTDGYPSDGHLSFIVEKDFKGIIKQGTPLVQVIPFKREGWKMEIVDSSESEGFLKKHRMNLRSTFSNGYKNKFRSPKDFS